MARKKDELLLGAHTSAAGGAYKAILEGHSIGATTVQLFTANQKQWKGKALTESAIENYETALAETHLSHIMSHAGYLINLGSPKEEVLTKSRQGFRDEIERCLALGITYLNFHPGAALDSDREECMDRIIESLLMVEDLMEGEELRLLFETTAGQGSTIGWQFEELAYLMGGTKKRLPMGVCIDTCHIFAAGYDIRTPKAWKETLDQFDETIGLEHLYAFHLNDSIHGLGSRKDRHAALGEGEIGIECFKFLMTHPKTKKLPKYLETPGGPPLWDKEIGMLRRFAGAD
jgi:deoxyribonuclease IV